MKYEFHVGDYVEKTNGRIGYIDSICQCKYCKALGFYEPYVIYTGGDGGYITAYESKNGFPEYKRIGQYDFTKIDEGKIEPLCEEYTKNFPLCKTTTTENDSEWRSIDLGAINKKINELVNAVNSIREELNNG